MNDNAFSDLVRSVRFNSAGFHSQTTENDAETATSSQEKILGFDQKRFRRAHIHIIGAGGIGMSILDSLLRKGIGYVDIYDRDNAELGNLGRQKFFPRDVGKNKAICGARNAIMHASWPSQVVAHPEWFQDAVRHGAVGIADAAICGPDNDETRVFTARYFYPMCPVINVGIGTQADHAYIFIQKPGSACFGCLFPEAVSNQRRPCPGTPQMIDLLLVTAGLVLTALDSVLMPGRKINWNYWDIYPSGVIPTQPVTIERREDCQICGKLK